MSLSSPTPIMIPAHTPDRGAASDADTVVPSNAPQPQQHSPSRSHIELCSSILSTPRIGYASAPAAQTETETKTPQSHAQRKMRRRMLSVPAPGFLSVPRRSLEKHRNLSRIDIRSRAEKEKENKGEEGEGDVPGMKMTARSVAESFSHLQLRPERYRRHEPRHSNSTSNSHATPIPAIKPDVDPRKISSSTAARPPSVSVRRKPSTESIQDMAIRPRVPGVFTPSLPYELWVLILRYASVAVLGFGPASASASSSSSGSFAHPTLADDNDSEYEYETSSDTKTKTKTKTAVSFLSHSHAHAHLPARLAQYNALLKYKASLTRVCRMWNAVGQEVLYEEVWIGRGREGRMLAGRLGGDAGGAGPGARAGLGVHSSVVASSMGGNAARRRGFGWFGRVRGRIVAPPLTTTSSSSSSASSAAPSSSSINNKNVGRFIRRLHIETASMEKCSPHDLLLILQHCPRLEAYVDYRSVRRPMHPLVLSLSPVVPFSVGSPSSSTSAVAHQQTTTSDILTPDALLHTLLARPLKHLTWTNYEYDGSDFDAGVRFYEDVVGPRLSAKGGVGEGLEFLEVVVSGRGVYGMGGGAGTGRGEAWGVSPAGEVGEEGQQDTEWRERRGGTLSVRTPLSSGVSAMKLTQLTARYTTTRTYRSSAALSDLPCSTSPSLAIEPSIDGFTYTLVLPSLRSLKVTLDNATFSVLSSWDMPRLTHLSVISADFGYAGAGFRRFFEVHGSKIRQLELGHSSGDIEEAWVTHPPPPPPSPLRTGSPTATTAASASPGSTPFSTAIPLAAWCPHLREFICSADAAWNWQRPDWIAPHVLLPMHPGVVFIGVRDLECRVRGDAEDAESRRRGTRGGGGGADQDNEDEGEDDPYFMLAEQFGSLLSAYAFPSLARVRDMSWESDVMRRTGRVQVDVSASALASSVFSTASSPATVGAPSIPRWLFPSSSSSSSKKNVHVSKTSPSPSASHLQQESQLARARSRNIRRFWAGVLERCAERGVVLEDCRGVGVEL
ncbi:hypothetical protein CVT25_005391 [Psilocybe cyanescens]|uniref:Uncharacterized protein n=1 Tax=Psilocybe cyanescens TaxID=93625 RepID=A0A409WXA9_PSICY|nr:hypothetical protein CVT25_005391 [Psilocybe cyanescens]